MRILVKKVIPHPKYASTGVRDNRVYGLKTVPRFHVSSFFETIRSEKGLVAFVFGRKSVLVVDQKRDD